MYVHTPRKFSVCHFHRKEALTDNRIRARGVNNLKKITHAETSKCNKENKI